MNIRPNSAHWLDSSSRNEIKAYLDFLNGMTQNEREVFVDHEIFGLSTGKIGQARYTGDVMDKWTCHDEARMYSGESEIISGILRGLEDRWKDNLASTNSSIGMDHDWRRIVIPEQMDPRHKDHARSRYATAVGFGFQRMTFEILFGDSYEEHGSINGPRLSREEWKKRHDNASRNRASLYLDTPRLNREVEYWLDNNRPLSSKSVAA